MVEFGIVLEKFNFTKSGQNVRKHVAMKQIINAALMKSQSIQ